MRLFLCALLLAAMPAAFAQSAEKPAPGANQQPGLTADLVAHQATLKSFGEPQHRGYCPLFLTAAAVDSPGQVMPVANTDSSGSGFLNLHFQYESEEPIRSVSITAHLRVKTNKYQMDAREVAVPLSFTGTKLDHGVEHSIQLQLPPDIYLFGVARVSVNSVMFADGAVWTPDNPDRCGVNGRGTMRIESK